jgi:beta-mannanase
MRFHHFFFIFLFSFSTAFSQLKFLLEDFEGMNPGASELKVNGLFAFGAVAAEIDNRSCTKQTYSGNRAIKVQYTGKGDFGGWGKGVSVNMELDQSTDYFNFYIWCDAGKTCTLNIELHEDDDNDGVFNKERDDIWTNKLSVKGKGGWQLVSIPLLMFSDSNQPGDGVFNISYKEGKLFVFLLSFENIKQLPVNRPMYFDFLCFSKGILPVSGLFEPVPAPPGSFCTLGAWSAEGNSANFLDIASEFEKNFKGGKKIGIIHFFQSFSVQGDGAEYHYPSVERINRVINAGYLPMITLEDHFVNTNSNTKQPNLYSILDGHFDSFFGYWAHQIKEVKGIVLLRILHEFNGDWYPWCTVKNDRNPELVGRAFRYIINIFRQNNVTNVRFIWCPNSMSVPQESWNFIMEAYPGDDYVDMIGLDIYNGAGSGKSDALWRSFRREGIENYFVLTSKKPGKPLLICETASRERRTGEQGQNKAEWIREMSVALKTDMSAIKLLAWFSEKATFKVNSSPASIDALQKHIFEDGYFRGGIGDFQQFIRR